MQIADRVKRIKSSSTVTMAAKAIALQESGLEIIDFGVGEPDFPTPENIKTAAVTALAENKTKYTTNNGLLDLRQAICEKLETQNRIIYRPEQILVSNGAKHALFNVMMSLIEQGDEVIIPAPYWSSYTEITKLAQGSPIIVNTTEDSGFHINGKQLSVAITDKTKVFILCNPTNPTGAAYNKEQLRDLVEVLVNRKFYIITDEIYEKLFYDNQKFVSLAAFDKLKDRTIVINGLSKAYAMTGWRIGYAAGPADVIKAAAKLQSHSTSAASTISQYAAIEALRGPQDEMFRMLSEFQKRRNYLMQRMESIPEITCQKPGGAFYVFPNISKYFGKKFNGKKISNSNELADYLLNEARVVSVPGAAFGAEGYLRISYATSISKIKEGVNRLTDALNKLMDT
jgi:aspartate aminotransferase